MNTLISVILPVRNGEKHIREAIDSVLAQTYPYFELVVVDASDDSTPEIVRSYQDARIKYHRQVTKGSINGYNEALDHYISGEYVTFIHHDDLYYPEKLYEQLRIFEKYADVDCVYNNIEFVDNELRTIRLRSHADFYNRNNDLLSVIMIGYGIANLGMQVLIKRDFIEKHHLRYCSETPTVCDHEYIFQMIDAGASFKLLDKYLFKYRIHGENESADREKVNREDLVVYSRYTLEYLRKAVSGSTYSDKEQDIIFGRLLFRLGYIESAIEHFVSILQTEKDPWAEFYLGTGYYRYKGDFKSAVKYLELALEQMPFRPEVINNIACCAYQCGNAKLACTLFEKAENMYPQSADARYNFECSTKGIKFNPRITDREIEEGERFGIVWRSAEMKRINTGDLNPMGNI